MLASKLGIALFSGNDQIATATLQSSSAAGRKMSGHCGLFYFPAAG
jgi:hypothetical protein